MWIVYKVMHDAELQQQQADCERLYGDDCSRFDFETGSLRTTMMVSLDLFCAALLVCCHSRH